MTKAYDKAWIDGIMYALYQNGIKTSLWNIIYNLNKGLQATISTKYGKTRTIAIKDSIRQGGVLSVMMYALLMDEISKEITQENLGVKIPNTDKKIGSLLWMDDLVKITDNTKEMQNMVNITENVSGPYRIVYGEEKTKAIKEGRRGEKTQFKLGEMEIKYTSKYKYLGQMTNEKGNAKDHITEVKGKAEGAYQTALLISGNDNFNDIEMETFWELLNSCVIPTITYSGTTINLTKTDEKEINRILDSIIKRTLMVPPSTPREVLYIETGLIDITTMIERNRILTHDRMKRNPSKLLDYVLTDDIKNGWTTKNTIIKSKMGITDLDLTGNRKNVKAETKKRMFQYFKKKIETLGSQKSKVQHLLEGHPDWKVGERSAYLSKLNRKQASTIFKARTRMLEVKNNYRRRGVNGTATVKHRFGLV